MEIRHVLEFISLAETNSYFETAERLFVTTSSLSRHIMALEEDLGVPLFDRTTRKVILNEYGKLFLPYARQLVHIADDCAAAFEEESQTVQGTLSIGSIPKMKAYRIDEILREFRQNNKNVILHIHEGDSTALVKLLQAGEIDFAFLRNRNVSVDAFETVPIAQDHLVAVLPKDHPPAQQQSIAVSQLEDESLLLISKNSFMHRLCIDLCKNAGFQPRVVLTSQRAENLMDLVEQGTGIALLMQKPIAPILPQNLCIVDIEPRVATTVFLAFQKGQHLTVAGRQFLSLCRSIPFET